jgi:hypothetical protein
MRRLVFCLSIIVLCGCDDDPTSSKSRKTAGTREAEKRKEPGPQMQRKQPGPPNNIMTLATPELFGPFEFPTFDWGLPGGNLDALSSQKELDQALLGANGGFTRIQRGRTVRIKEVYFDRHTLMRRWQEELRDGRWVKHGPDVGYRQDGSYEVLFRIDGKPEGPRISFNANGQETARWIYKRGILVK